MPGPLPSKTLQSSEENREAGQSIQHQLICSTFLAVPYNLKVFSLLVTIRNEVCLGIGKVCHIFHRSPNIYIRWCQNCGCISIIQRSDAAHWTKGILCQQDDHIWFGVFFPTDEKVNTSEIVRVRDAFGLGGSITQRVLPVLGGQEADCASSHQFSLPISSFWLF